MIKKNLNINEVKKFLQKKGFIISKKNKNYSLEFNNLSSISRTFLSSIIIISIFFITPNILNLKIHKS